MKKIISILLVMVLGVSIFACAKNQKDTGKVTNEGESIKKDAFYDEDDTVQLTDGAGRLVSFPEPAKTVATSWGGAVDTFLFALNVTDRIVATKSGNNMHKLCIEDMENMPSVGRWDLDAEALATISPDVFLHAAFAEEILESANKVNVRSVGLNFNTMADVTVGTEMLGVVFGVEERAKYVIDYYEKIMKIVEEHVAEIPESERYTVVVLGHEKGQIASSSISPTEEMIKYAGGISCVPQEVLAANNTEVGEEKIFKWNPDVIFIQESLGELTPEVLLADATWAGMKAVQSKKVYAIPCVADAWSTASPSSCLGVLYMSMQMYPAYYDDIDFESIVVQFYKDIYNLNLTRDELGF